MEVLVLAAFLTYNACLLVAVALLVVAVIKAWTARQNRQPVPRQFLLVVIIVAALLLAGQAAVNHHVQNEGVAEDRLRAQNSGLDIYEPKATIAGDKVQAITMGNAYTVDYGGRTLERLNETKMSQYNDVAPESECYLTTEALESRNKDLQNVTVTGFSDGRPSIETPTNPNYTPITNDCLSLGKTANGVEVFVENARYNRGYDYDVLAVVGNTFVRLEFNEKAPASDIVNYVGNLKLTPAKDVTFVNKSNRLLITNHF